MKIHKDFSTSYTTPSTNIFAGTNNLRKALASGSNAKLIRMWNEDCDFPIKVKNTIKDIRFYKSSGATMNTRAEIISSDMDENEKHIKLNYSNCFGINGSDEIYRKTGVLSKDNVFGMGVSHLVKVTDLIKLYKSLNDKRAEMLEDQYINESGLNGRHFFDTINYNKTSKWLVKKFKKKVWVVATYNNEHSKHKIPMLVKIMNWVMFPLKFIPTKSVLKMGEYIKYSFRIGDVINGYTIEFQIPKKFSF